MDKLRENLSRFINRIKKGAYRQAKLSRAAGRRFSQGMRKRLGRLDPQKRLIALCGGGVVCAAIVAVIIIAIANGASAANANADGSDTRTGISMLSAENDAAYVPVPTPTLEPTPIPTLAPTPTPFDPTLKRGMEREDVEPLQLRLMELGYMADDEPTIKFGPATEAAVRLFQRQINFTDTIDATLDEDGIAGEQTLALLFAADAPRYVVKYGMEGDDIGCR